MPVLGPRVHLALLLVLVRQPQHALPPEPLVHLEAVARLRLAEAAPQVGVERAERQPPPLVRVAALRPDEQRVALRAAAGGQRLRVALLAGPREHRVQRLLLRGEGEAVVPVQPEAEAGAEVVHPVPRLLRRARLGRLARLSGHPEHLVDAAGGGHRRVRGLGERVAARVELVHDRPAGERQQRVRDALERELAAQEHHAHALLRREVGQLRQEVRGRPPEVVPAHVADDDHVVRLRVQVEQRPLALRGDEVGLADDLVHVEPLLAPQGVAEQRLLPAELIDDQHPHALLVHRQVRLGPVVQRRQFARQRFDLPVLLDAHLHPHLDLALRVRRFDVDLQLVVLVALQREFLVPNAIFRSVVVRNAGGDPRADEAVGVDPRRHRHFVLDERGRRVALDARHRDVLPLSAPLLTGDERGNGRAAAAEPGGFGGGGEGLAVVRAVADDEERADPRLTQPPLEDAVQHYAVIGPLRVGRGRRLPPARRLVEVRRAELVDHDAHVLVGEQFVEQGLALLQHLADRVDAGLPADLVLHGHALGHVHADDEYGRLLRVLVHADARAHRGEQRDDQRREPQREHDQHAAAGGLRVAEVRPDGEEDEERGDGGEGRQPDRVHRPRERRPRREEVVAHDAMIPECLGRVD